MDNLAAPTALTDIFISKNGFQVEILLRLKFSKIQFLSQQNLA